MSSTKDENKGVRGKSKNEQFNAAQRVVGENKVRRYSGPANWQKKFLWTPLQQDYHFQTEQLVVGNSVERTEERTISKSWKSQASTSTVNVCQPNIVTGRNYQQEHRPAIDQTNTFNCRESNKPLTESNNNANFAYPTTAHYPGSGNLSKYNISKSNAKSNLLHHATFNKKLVSEVPVSAKGRSKNLLSKDTLEGSDTFQAPLSSQSHASRKIICEKDFNSSVQQRTERQRCPNDKKNTSSKLNTHRSKATFLSNYNAWFLKKHLKVGHNPCKRFLHMPEISYIIKDKMCWFKPRRFRQPRRLIKYRYAATLEEDFNQLRTGALLLPPKVNSECHIFGFSKVPFKDCFKKLCEIIGVEDMNILNVRRENGATVIQLNDSDQRNQLLAAYKYYEGLVKAGSVPQLTSKLCGSGSKKNRIFIRPGSKNVKNRGDEKPIENGIQIFLSAENWMSVLYRQRPILVSETERRAYGTIINTSKILCHSF